MVESNRFSRFFSETGQGWGKDIMPYFNKTDIRVLCTVNKKFNHAIFRPPVKKGWDWQFHCIEGKVSKELSSPLEYPDIILSTESTLLVSGTLSHCIHVISKKDGKLINTLKCSNEYNESCVWSILMIDTEIYVLLYDQIIVLKGIDDDTIVRRWNCLGLDMINISEKIMVLYEKKITIYDTNGNVLNTISTQTQTPCKSLLAIHDDIAVLDITHKQLLVLSLNGAAKYTIPCPFVSSQWVCMTFMKNIEEIVVSDNTGSIVSTINTFSKIARIINSGYFFYPQVMAETEDGLWVADRNNSKLCLLT
jgi:hypothetical protein